MPFFKVKLEPVEERPSGGGQMKNPFEPVRLLDLGTTVTARVWPRVEASDKTEVRRLFREAQRDGLENVRGHRILSIEEVE